MFPDASTIWSIALAGVTNADIQSYIDDYGLTPEAPTDAKVIADLTTAKAAAAASGNSGFEAILGKVLTYGDKVLAILSKNGIIKNQNLTSAGYSIDLNTIAKDASTSSAPDASNRVFNIDFTDPKVLIITFLLLMILFYFLFFNPSTKHAYKR